MVNNNLAARLEQRLPTEYLELIRSAGQLAGELGLKLYLAGGAVRDLLLEKDTFDLDLVVEGDALKLAGLLAQKKDGTIIVHQRFGTAKVSIDKSSIDFATARSETYAFPGALPTVHPGSFKDDLRRRDFTINAMAINLGPDEFGDIIDPYQGRDDLKHKLIRILHKESFRDDATRILRALRYEQRLDFKLEPTTEGLLRRDTAMLDTISGDRIRHELELILKEKSPEKVLQRAQGLGVINRIHPSLKSNEWLQEKFQEARSVSSPTPAAIYFSLLLYQLNPKDMENFIARLKIPKTIAQVIRDTLRVKEITAFLNTPELSSGAIYRLLHGYQPLAVLANALASDSALISQRLHLYLDKLRYVKTSLNGRALQQMGIPPGPRLGEILTALQEAKLDQKVKTKDDEIELVRHWSSQGK